ncbi:MAG TPA: acyclic terpene utilization AtuA family protein, partial [Acidimicrobiia bacterium]|nr:acyclic terpene utilization AtuA family protein [Acidimicrobiia bacterium]
AAHIPAQGAKNGKGVLTSAAVGVRLAGGQGFYGDTPKAVAGLLEEGVDYLCLEALAELTLAILQKDRQRDESLGYTRDLPLYLHAALPAVAEGRTKIITNAGGINPTAAARAAVETARSMGITGIKVATVLGDDLMPRLGELRDAGVDLANLDTGEPWDLPAEPVFAAAYVGAAPIVAALDQGADVVITGRVADASLFLAPCMFEHGWAPDDWDRLAAGILVGHLLECSGQSTGGNYSGDWWTLPHPWDLPYPMAEVEADGSAVISKPAPSGGRVSFDTVRHQLLYEVHDPANYLSPDVVADFTSARFDDLGDDRVRVSEVQGRPVTSTYKALVAYPAGWAGEAKVAFSWPEAHEKAKAAGALLRKRVEMAGLAVDEWHTEFWGVNALGGDTVPSATEEPPEVILRVAWRCSDPQTAGLVGRELVPLSLSAPPAGFTGTGRAGGGKPSQLLGIWPTLVDRALVDDRVTVTVEEVV